MAGFFPEASGPVGGTVRFSGESRLPVRPAQLLGRLPRRPACAGDVRAILLFVLLTAVGAAEPPAPAERRAYADDFAGDLSQWVVEQQPGGRVWIADGKLVIDDIAGCTVWFRPRLVAPVEITYEATVSSTSRVSDLNCFWMATEPRQPAAAPYSAGHARDGRFAAYDSLRTYYVGYGGNDNHTTRFRRYDGLGGRPLLPQHDLSAKGVLLVPNHPYRITVRITADGRAQWSRDGEVIFDFADPIPLTSGWFAFRTVKSRIEIAHFRVSGGK